MHKLTRFVAPGPKYRRSNAIQCRKNAHFGKVSDQFHIGRFCLYGCGVKRDVHEAIKWFRKAGDLKISTAQLLYVFRERKRLFKMEDQSESILDQYQIQVIEDKDREVISSELGSINLVNLAGVV